MFFLGIIPCSPGVFGSRLGLKNSFDLSGDNRLDVDGSHEVSWEPFGSVES